MPAAPLTIVFPVYPGATHLDFTGPHQFLSRLPGAQLIVASVAGEAVTADGLTFAGLERLSDVQACDVLCVPGGLGCIEAMNDPAFLGEVRRLAKDARYLTSVCTGSLILGAAGLLVGKRAACHWAWRHLLPLFGAVPDPGRVVRDGNILTGGGVTAGIDFALTLAAEIAGPETAQTIQLGLEYAPAAPFDAGRPETAPAEVLAGYQARMAGLMAGRQAGAEKAAAAMMAPA